MKKNSFFALLLILSFDLLAGPVGAVSRMRGKVSILPPGAHKAHQAKSGEKVYQDTSILTKKKSFVRIKMNDGSKISLGPNSKMVLDEVKESSKSTTMVGLIKGAIRSQVQKNYQQKDEKMLIKTPSAVMGVRGTEFQVSYNDQNDITGLLTLEGEVAMTKLEKKEVAEMTKNKKLIKKRLRSKNVVKVDKARYSGTSLNLKDASRPVTINPVQYAKLKVVDDFGVSDKKIDKKKMDIEIKKAKQEISKLVQKRGEDPHESYDPKTGIYKPRSGGFMEIETGFYIPPEGKKIDQETKLFEDKAAERKVASDGNYKLPDGVRLDAKKGFIAQDGSKEAAQEVAKLNDAIKGQVVKPRKPSEQDLKLNDRDAYERFFR